MTAVSSHPHHPLDAAAKSLLLDLAHDAVRYGLERGLPMPEEAVTYPDTLCFPGSTFVTLKLDGGLRGCVGTLEQRYPVALDVVRNAHGAAFLDPRFQPLSREEYHRTTLSIALLSAHETVACRSEADLLAALKPGIDGLILEDGPDHRATFLPAVWESVAEPEEFLRQLKLKAGLPALYWSPSLRFKRYTTELIA